MALAMKTTKPDLSRLLELQRLLITFSNISRMVDRRDADTGYVRENDAEHSYNLAMAAWFLSSYFPDLDQTEILKLALAHDLLEVHAGDTYIYGEASHLASKSTREAAALEELERAWPDFPEMTEYMHRYNNRLTPEAKFVYALDKIMPIFLIYVSDGYSWKQQQVTVTMLDEHKRSKVALSPEIAPYYEQLYDLLTNSPDLIKP